MLPAGNTTALHCLVPPASLDCTSRAGTVTRNVK